MVEKSENFKILVVDDEKDIRNMLSAFLKKEKYMVKEAEDGDVAVERLDSELFDLVLLDNRMPKRGGLEVLEIIKRDYPKTSVIMISAYDDQSDINSAKAFGADFIAKGKPFDQKELFVKVEKAIAIQRDKSCVGWVKR